MLAFFNRRELRKRNKKKAIFAVFKDCLITDELAIAMKMWNQFNPILNNKVDEIH